MRYNNEPANGSAKLNMAPLFRRQLVTHFVARRPCRAIGVRQVYDATQRRKYRATRSHDDRYTAAGSELLMATIK